MSKSPASASLSRGGSDLVAGRDSNLRGTVAVKARATHAIGRIDANDRPAQC